MRRISVVGSSGSGKTTLARRLAHELDVEHVELDALFWGPDWSQADAAAMRAAVDAAVAAERWVIDGNYRSRLGTRVLDRADTVVWVNPPRWRAMTRSMRRTVRRIVLRERLWADNRESWRGLAFWRGEESILWWAWTTHATTQERYEQDLAAAPAGQVWFRVRTRADARRVLELAAQSRGE